MAAATRGSPAPARAAAGPHFQAALPAETLPAHLHLRLPSRLAAGTATEICGEKQGTVRAEAGDQHRPPSSELLSPWHKVGMLPDQTVPVAVPRSAYLPLGAARSAAHTPPCCRSGSGCRGSRCRQRAGTRRLFGCSTTAGCSAGSPPRPAAACRTQLWGKRCW